MPYTTTTTTLRYATTNTTTAQLQLHYTISSSGGWDDHCNHSKKHNSNHLSGHQWIRSAIHASQQLASPMVSHDWNFRHRLVCGTAGTFRCIQRWDDMIWYDMMWCDVIWPDISYQWLCTNTNMIRHVCSSVDVQVRTSFRSFSSSNAQADATQHYHLPACIKNMSMAQFSRNDVVQEGFVASP